MTFFACPVNGIKRKRYKEVTKRLPTGYVADIP
jgi:hypothetical protein